AGLDVDVAIERLAVTERHRGRRPREEADRRRRGARPAALPERLVHRHVRRAVRGLRHEQPPGPAAGPVRHASSIARDPGACSAAWLPTPRAPRAVVGESWSRSIMEL